MRSWWMICTALSLQIAGQDISFNKRCTCLCYGTTVESRSDVACTTAPCPVAFDAQVPPIIRLQIYLGIRAHRPFDAGTQSYALLAGPHTAILVHEVQVIVLLSSCMLRSFEARAGALVRQPRMHTLFSGRITWFTTLHTLLGLELSLCPRHKPPSSCHTCFPVCSTVTTSGWIYPDIYSLASRVF
ncbi:hypothetical protein CY34DRAFT_248714 [Suillus luteus UH-Slu-Lm8-n1]|uniref:Secreted protein n=1 Tax=Suillus luteus UH-Slu-Lm8-n1 TaxID=930992 RepID=A0A0D0AAY0_9AGAM|nr:hypothetical protein CY34DRAFT_248714 [Suillus luteus UH-Slu-Lm8-n1]